jgi:hypothetical protein
VCTGKNAFEAQKDQYRRAESQWRNDFTGKNNVWGMKNDQYEINTAENVNAYTRQIGGIQRNFNLDIQQFMKNNETLFKTELQKTPIDEGGRSSSFGRSMKLAALYEKSAQKANIRRAGVKQGEKLNAAYRGLLSAQAVELGKRGFQPIPSEAPAKPKGPSFLDQAISVASTAASFVAPISGLASGLKGLKNLSMGTQAAQGFSGQAFSGGSAFQTSNSALSWSGMARSGVLN